MVLPIKVDVYWDEEGVGDDPHLVRMTRWLTARGLAEASGGMVARQVNTILPHLTRQVSVHDVRTSIGTYIKNPSPEVPVQIEIAFTILPDPEYILLRQAETLRLSLAVEVMNWFENQVSGTCERGKVSAVRHSLWLGEVLVLELDPVNRRVISGEGGNISTYPPGYRIPRA